VEPSGKDIINSPLIDVYDLKDIKCANPMITYSEESLSGAEIVARTINGNVCGFAKPLGKGNVWHLGTWMGFDTEGHKPVYEAILRTSGATLRQASSDNVNLAVRERFTNDHTALLFIGNYYNEEQSGRVHYTHPGSGERISIPYTRNDLLWPPLYGVLTPVCLEVTAGLKILHSTSDILQVEEAGGQLSITLSGDRDLPGEIVFEGPGIHRMDSAELDSERIELVPEGGRIAINYSHIHRKEMILEIRITA
jgi:hypothetical protein